MNKNDIIKNKVSVDNFIETREINDLTSRFDSGNVTRADIYNVYRGYNDKRNEYWFQELIEGFEVDKKQNGEMITFDAGDYITKAIDEGLSVKHCVMFLKLPTKSVNMYLEYMGYDTMNTATESVQKLIDVLIDKRTKSRKMYYNFMGGEYDKLIKEEKEIKKEIVEKLDKTDSRKKIKHNKIYISCAKEYSKKNISVAKIVEVLGAEQANELFGIDTETHWEYNITTKYVDSEVKKGLDNGTKK